MAQNIRVFGASPRLPVDLTAGAHGSGDLGVESGKFGICVEANAVGQPNTLIERCTCVLPAPSTVLPGWQIYAAGPLTEGQTLQEAPKRSSAVPVHAGITAQAPFGAAPVGGVLIGTAVTAAYYDGLSQVAQIELAPQ